VADHAELLAHHYGEALLFARAAGLPEQELAQSAGRFLIQAAERAERLDLTASESLYLEALELLDPHDPERTRVLARLGWLAQFQARLREAEERFMSAIAEADAAGRAKSAVDAIAGLAQVKRDLAEERSADDLLQYWIGRLDGEEPDADLGPLYSAIARRSMVAVRLDEQSRYADRAIAAFTAAGNAAGVSRALQFRGSARADGEGDYEGGLKDMEESVRLGRELGLGIELAHALVNLGDYVWRTEGPAAALEHYDAGIALAEQRSLLQIKGYARGERLWILFDLGRWDELLTEADDLIAAGSPITVEGFALPYKANVLMRRGETAKARELPNRYLDRLRQIGDPQSLAPGLLAAALVALAVGDRSGALSLVGEIGEVEASLGQGRWRHYCLPDVARICAAAGDLELAHRIRVSDSQRPVLRNELAALSADAILAEASGALPDALRLYAEAAARWQQFGQVSEHAHALLGHGRVALALGQPGADESLRAAHGILTSLDYQAPLAETENLLADATT
jgi:tetratricopeptide (TPR) repeat protein